MAASVGRAISAEHVPAVENTSLVEVPVPPRFVGKTLGSLDVRNRYGVTVLLIKQQGNPGEEVINATPSAHYEFQVGDTMLIMGPDDSLRRLARGYF